jgi:hypothetical protein
MKNTTNNGHGGRPLYPTVLSLAIAALVAAWLPFTVFYVTALSHTPAAQVASVTYNHGQRVITTRTSGGQTVRSVTASGTQVAQPTQIPVTTRAS